VPQRKHIFIDLMRSDISLQQNSWNDENRYKEIFASVGLRKGHLIFPLFISESPGMIESMPNMAVTSLRKISKHVQSILDNGISSLIVFGIPKKRDETGSFAYERRGIVQEATREIKSNFGSAISVVTDVCICQYNLSGHCGIVDKDGKVNNDTTLRVLAKVAASHAKAGADIVAPSAMMDGQVQAIRTKLQSCGLNTPILSFSAKHASSLYAPFRSAAFTNRAIGVDKSSYQLPYSSSRVALREIETDIIEGANMVMIKPALMYLDLVRMVKEKFNFPVAVQNVSGEYAMIKAAAMRGWIDEEEWKVRSIASIQRAGADKIISYFVLDIARYL
jgi:porphobilinogen synthase